MKDEKFSKICKTILIVCGIVIAVSVAIIIIVTSISNKQREKAISAYTEKIAEETASDAYIENIYGGEYVVAIQVNNDFLKLSNKDKLEEAEKYVMICTGALVHFPEINHNEYISINIYSSTGKKIIESNHFGEINIVK